MSECKCSVTADEVVMDMERGKSAIVGVPVINYCPTHAAAFEMRRRLKRLTDEHPEPRFANACTCGHCAPARALLSRLEVEEAKR